MKRWIWNEYGMERLSGNRVWKRGGDGTDSEGGVKKERKREKRRGKREEMGEWWFGTKEGTGYCRMLVCMF